MTNVFNQKYHISNTYLYTTRAGTLNIAGNLVTINSTGRWNGSTLESFGGSGSNPTYAGLCIYGTASDVYVGGYFTTVSGLSIPYISRWNGTEWSTMNSLGSTLNANVGQLAYDVSNGYVYTGSYQTATTANRIVKYSEATNTWEGIASGFTISTYPKMAVDASSHLWMAYGTIVKRYDPGTTTWTDISNASANVEDLKYGNNGRVYFAGGTNISYISTTTTGPHVALTGLQGGVSSAAGVDVLTDGSVVACFQSPSAGDATNNVQLYDGTSWTGIYKTANNSGNLGLWVDANDNIYIFTNGGTDVVGVSPYGANGWRGLSDTSMSAVTYGGSVAAALSAPSITISGGSSQVLTKDIATTVTLSATNSPTSWSITPSLTPINMIMNGTTGEITGTPSTEDITGTTYTITATNNDGDGTTNLTLAVRDSYTVDMINSASYSIIQTVSAGVFNPVDESTIFTDISAYITPGNGATTRVQRHTLLKYVLSRSSNSGYTYITSNRASLGLPDTYSKDKIRVYRTSNIIDLNDLSGDEGAYAPISQAGESCTFLNVGGNSNSVMFSANGDNTYNIQGNGVDLGSAIDGEELILFGVAFYIGSVGTEGTAGDAICFTGDAMVLTKDGEKRIDKIASGDIIVDYNGNHHDVKDTIRVVNSAKLLIHISKDALSMNCPNNDTTVTPEHQILYQEEWTKAQDLLCHPGAKEIEPEPYQYVYHLTLSNGRHMIVNGMIAETLHPDNINVHTRERIILR
jgi:hypothetical protein